MSLRGRDRETPHHFNLLPPLLNPWDEGRPVQHSGDGQALPQNIGERICTMIDRANELQQQQGVDDGGGGVPHELANMDYDEYSKKSSLEYVLLELAS